MNYRTNTSKGFTLVETLIAIAILTVAVGSAFTIAQKTLQSSAFSKNQTIAYFLASEGLEMVRNIRDNTSLFNKTQPLTNQADWLQPFKSRCNNITLNDTNCIFDINPLASNFKVTTGGALADFTIMKRVAEETDPNVCNTTKGCRLRIVSIDPNATSTAFTSINTSTAFSIFWRKITITEVDAGSGTGAEGDWSKKEAVVTSTVTWFDQTFTLKETLTNWQ